MSFSQGISGLNVAAANLDVIGNNIANSGTVGYKSCRENRRSLLQARSE